MLAPLDQIGSDHAGPHGQQKEIPVVKGGSGGFGFKAEGLSNSDSDPADGRSKCRCFVSDWYACVFCSTGMAVSLREDRD